MIRDAQSGQIPTPGISLRILILRGQRAMLDADLAELYGVSTKRLNEQVKRNRERFPADFMFQLTETEKSEVVANCDHLSKLKYSKALPFAFTEHGAIQASNVLGTPQAISMGVYVVRSFIHLRELAASHRELSLRLDELEQKAANLALKQDVFEGDAKAQIREILEVLRELMEPPAPANKRPIGFIAPEEQTKKARKTTARRNPITH